MEWRERIVSIDRGSIPSSIQFNGDAECSQKNSLSHGGLPFGSNSFGWRSVRKSRSKAPREKNHRLGVNDSSTATWPPESLRTRPVIRHFLLPKRYQNSVLRLFRFILPNRLNSRNSHSQYYSFPQHFTFFFHLWTLSKLYIKKISASKTYHSTSLFIREYLPKKKLSPNIDASYHYFLKRWWYSGNIITLHSIPLNISLLYSLQIKVLEKYWYTTYYEILNKIHFSITSLHLIKNEIIPSEVWWKVLESLSLNSDGHTSFFILSRENFHVKHSVILIETVKEQIGSVFIHR